MLHVNTYVQYKTLQVQTPSFKCKCIRLHKVAENLFETVMHFEPKSQHIFVFKSWKRKQMNTEDGYRFLNFEALASAKVCLTLK